MSTPTILAPLVDRRARSSLGWLLPAKLWFPLAALAIVGLAMQWVWFSTFLGATAPSDRHP